MTTFSTAIENSGTGYTVSANSEIVTITATGALIGDGGYGLYDSYAGTVIRNSGYLGGLYGAFVGGSGNSLTNLASGVISGVKIGLLATGATTDISNFGSITGYVGVKFDGVTPTTLENAGRIDGSFGVVVNAVPNTTITNSGTIAGSQYAIDSRIFSVAANDHLTIANTGTIMGNIKIDTTIAAIHNDGLIQGNITFGTGINTLDGIGTVRGNVTGGTDNDTFDLSHETVVGGITGNGGEDTVAFTSASAGFAIDLSQGTAFDAGQSYHFLDIADVTGSAFADTITGDSDANVIMAGAGADTVNAGAGIDTVYGNGGADILNGNGGADTLIGGAGADTLTGGSGNDIFLYSLVSDSPISGPDLITDFVHGQDKIDLTRLHLVSAGDVKITSSGGVTHVAIDANHDGSAEMLINLTGTNVLTSSDILGLPGAAPAALAGDADAVTSAAVHHGAIAMLHAVAFDHGLYG